MSTVTFSDLDPSAVESSVIKAYEKAAKTTLYPGDPVRLFLESLAYILTIQNGVINAAGQQELLAYATGGHLDALASLVGVDRLAASPAQCTQRFTLETAVTFDVVIPAGTQVATADGTAIFSTDKTLTIPAGALSGTVGITADEPGSKMNGLIAGQISVMVTPLAYVSETENVTATVYGADGETDDRLRERTQEAPEAFTCAGPAGMYRALALAVHPDISDVAIWTPVPGTVDIRPIMTGGELPTAEVLERIRQVLSADDVRPLTDTVTVNAPELAPYTIDVSWSIAKSSEAMLATVRAAVEDAVESYRKWQRAAPGRDIVPTKLISLMEQAGARRVVVTSPAYTALEPRQIARETSVTCTFLGPEDE